jgi:hypothetical protein
MRARDFFTYWRKDDIRMKGEKKPTVCMECGSDNIVDVSIMVDARIEKGLQAHAPDTLLMPGLKIPVKVAAIECQDCEAVMVNGPMIGEEVIRHVKNASMN